MNHMPVDRAIGVVRSILAANCKDTPDYLQALYALEILEHASEALQSAHRVMTMHLSGDFDKDLHGVMQINAIREIDRITK
jgi:hypothetical protein